MDSHRGIVIQHCVLYSDIIFTRVACNLQIQPHSERCIPYEVVLYGVDRFVYTNGYN